jgi:hypothetical protein
MGLKGRPETSVTNCQHRVTSQKTAHSNVATWLRRVHTDGQEPFGTKSYLRIPQETGSSTKKIMSQLSRARACVCVCVCVCMCVCVDKVQQVHCPTVPFVLFYICEEFIPQVQKAVYTLYLSHITSNLRTVATFVHQQFFTDIVHMQFCHLSSRQTAHN